MLISFTIEDFKAFSRPAEIAFSDLMLIAGSNSGGKSTILQSLLLLAQTLDNPRQNVALDLGGQYIQFAEFREVVFSRPKSKPSFDISFDIQLKSPNPIDIELFSKYYLSRRYRQAARRNRSSEEEQINNRVQVEIKFAADRSGTPIILHTNYTKEIPNLGSINLKISKKQGKAYAISTSLHSNRPGRPILAETLLRKLEELLNDLPKLDSEGYRHTIFFEDNFVRPLREFGFSIEEVPEIGLELESRFAEADIRNIDAEKLAAFLIDVIIFTFQNNFEKTVEREFVFNHFLIPRTTTLYSLGKDGKSQEVSLSLFQLVGQIESIFGDAATVISDYLSSIQYLGPLRAKPERAYLAIGTPVGIGNSGENAVPILWLNRNDRVLNKTKIGEKPKEQRLEQGVQSWLEEFGLGTNFHITSKQVIYQAEIDSSPYSETTVTIADVGFGVSQLLPVIVAGLLAPKNTTLIYEQPEIHLHPRLQGKLADFLICLSEMEKKVIVETHSEHLVNMLRLRIAQDKSGNLKETTGILFVKPASRAASDTDRGATIEILKLDDYGKIINWPSDFFPESSEVNEALLKAMINRFPGD